MVPLFVWRERNGTFICLAHGCFVNSKDANVAFSSQHYIFVSKHENTMSFLSEMYQWSNSWLDSVLTTTYGIPSQNILVKIRLYKLQLNWSDIAASSDHWQLALQEKTYQGQPLKVRVNANTLHLRTLFDPHIDVSTIMRFQSQNDVLIFVLTTRKTTTAQTKENIWE